MQYATRALMFCTTAFLAVLMTRNVIASVVGLYALFYMVGLSHEDGGPEWEWLAVGAGVAAGRALLAAVEPRSFETRLPLLPFFPKYALELTAAAATFLRVDERVAETRYPVGLVRTYLMLLAVMMLAYGANQTDSELRLAWTSTRNYDCVATVGVLAVTAAFVAGVCASYAAGGS